MPTDLEQKLLKAARDGICECGHVKKEHISGRGGCKAEYCRCWQFEVKMQAVINHANPPGLQFESNGKTIKYVYPDTQHPAAGWLLFKHPDGQWVTLRKATDDDLRRINEAVVAAHHA